MKKQVIALVILFLIAVLPSNMLADSSARTKILDAYYAHFGKDAVLYCGGTMGGEALFSEPPDKDGEPVGEHVGGIALANIVKVLDSIEVKVDWSDWGFVEWLLIETAWGDTGWLCNIDNPSGLPGRDFMILKPVTDTDWDDRDYYWWTVFYDDLMAALRR